MKVVNKVIEEYNPGMKRRVLIVFDDMIADMISNRYEIKYVFDTPQKIILSYNKRCKTK